MLTEVFQERPTLVMGNRRLVGQFETMKHPHAILKQCKDGQSPNDVYWVVEAVVRVKIIFDKRDEFFSQTERERDPPMPAVVAKSNDWAFD